MVVTESTARVDVFQEIFNIINSNKLSGWTVLATFPEQTPVFPSIIVHPAEVTNNIRSLDRSERTNMGGVEIELIGKASSGMVKIDEGKDNIIDTLRTAANISTLETAKIDVVDIDDLGTTQERFRDLKINTGGLRVNLELLV